MQMYQLSTYLIFFQTDKWIMYSKIFEITVSISSIAMAIELIQVDQSLIDAMVDLNNFIKDMEEISFN